jgi:Flp pilus assembly protein TadB
MELLVAGLLIVMVSSLVVFISGTLLATYRGRRRSRRRLARQNGEPGS